MRKKLIEQNQYQFTQAKTMALNFANFGILHVEHGILALK